MAKRYPAPKRRGYRLVWQHSYRGRESEERSLDKLVDADLKARRLGFETWTVGVPGRHLLYASNRSLESPTPRLPGS